MHSSASKLKINSRRSHFTPRYCLTELPGINQSLFLLQVIVPAPYWVSYPSMAELAGGKAVVAATDPADGFLLQPQQLRAALSPASRVLILCSPSNPTGAVYPLERLKVPNPWTTLLASNV